METKLEVVEMPIESIVPYEKNPRLNEDAVDAVAESIRNYGWRQPIVVNEDNVIIVGHTRRLAAMKLGLKTVPVHVAKGLTPEQEKAYRLDDNKTSELSTWDFAMLKEEAEDLKDSGYDMDTLAFGKDELNRILASDDEEDNSAPEEDGGDDESDSGVEESGPEEDAPGTVYDSVPGGIYRLGEHRLVCGDCCEGLDISRLFEGDGEAPAALWLTDPPYNVNYVGRAHMNRVTNGISPAVRNKDMTLANDNMSDEDFEKFICKAFANCQAFLFKGATAYIFHAHTVAHIFRKAILDCGLTLANQLIWVKNHFALGWGTYLMKHEPIYLCFKPGAAHRWFGRHDSTTTTVQKWQIVPKSDIHPSMKPVPMLEYFIRNSTEKGDIVLDTFGGSGSTLIACENTGRRCRMMELMPKYADAIRKRWAEQVFGEGCDWQAKAPKVGDVIEKRD